MQGKEEIAISKKNIIVCMAKCNQQNVLNLCMSYDRIAMQKYLAKYSDVNFA